MAVFLSYTNPVVMTPTGATFTVTFARKVGGGYDNPNISYDATLLKNMQYPGQYYAKISSSSSDPQTYSVNLPVSILNDIPGTSLTVYLDGYRFYNGGVDVDDDGSAHQTVPITIQVGPTVGPTINDIAMARIDNDVPPAWGVFVQGHSQAQATIQVTHAPAATLLNSSLYGAGFYQVRTDLQYTTTRIQAGGDVTYQARVTDSRGRQAVFNKVIQVLPWTAPYLKNYKVFRCDADGSPARAGAYISVSADVIWSPCNNGTQDLNFIVVAVQIKETTSGIWSDPVDVGLTSSAPTIIDAGLSVDSTYDVQYLLSDQFGSYIVQGNVSSGEYTFHFKRGGTGVAVGKAAEYDNLFDIGLPTLFRDDVTVTVNAQQMSLQDLFLASTSAFSASSALSPITNGLRKQGGIVSVEIVATVSSTFTAQTNIGTFPTGWFAPGTLGLNVYLQNTPTKRSQPIYSYVDTDGSLLVQNMDGYTAGGYLIIIGQMLA
ncbi:MAG: DUF859 domain-containing protein [Christensenellaceae bacterium]|jgi:hypothetical protein|nr:DUF859 domain-containing protein [Christensenellaceae bacterium]